MPKSQIFIDANMSFNPISKNKILAKISKFTLNIVYPSFFIQILWALTADSGLTSVIRGAQWLSGRVLDSRLNGSGLEPHRRHCVVVLEQDTFILA